MFSSRRFTPRLLVLGGRVDFALGARATARSAHWLNTRGREVDADRKYDGNNRKYDKTDRKYDRSDRKYDAQKRPRDLKFNRTRRQTGSKHTIPKKLSAGRSQRKST